MAQIKSVDSPEALTRCTAVIQSLRPQLSEAQIAAYFSVMQDQQYHMICIEHENNVVAFAGYRFITHFFSGNIIYVDDLATLPQFRQMGFAGILIDHIFQIAKDKALDGVRLDSGHHRYDAHRFYLNKGFQIVSHHFSKKFN